MAYKTRHTHNVLIIVILAVVFVILVPIIVVYFVIDDRERNETNYDTGVSMSEVFNDKLFDSLELVTYGETDSKDYIFSLSDTEINEILHSLLGSYLGPSYGIPIDNNYVNNEKGLMVIFDEEIRSFIFTRLIIDTTLATYIDDEDYHNSAIYFDIDEVRIGGIGGLKNLAMSLLDMIIDMDAMMASLQNQGFNIRYDSENARFIYGIDDFFHDILDSFNMGDNGLYIQSFMDIISSNNLIMLNSYNDHLLELVARMDGFITGSFNGNDVPFEEVTLQVESLLEKGIITTTDQATTVFLYLTRGYNVLSEQQKAVIIRTDLSSLGIRDEDKQDYVSIKQQLYPSDFSAILSDYVHLDNLNLYGGKSLILQLPISVVSNYFGSLSLNGQLYYMMKDNDLRYVGICNVGCSYNPRSKIFSFNITMTVNGDLSNIIVNYRLLSSHNTIAVEYESNSIGNYTLSDDTVLEYIKQLEESFANNSYFSMSDDALDINFNFDFSSYIPDNWPVGVDVDFELDANYIYGYASVYYTGGDTGGE